MIVISPKWIYTHNNKLETDKSILIDGPIILDIVDNETVEKSYKEISRIKYSKHILMPTFTECYYDTNECLNINDIESKMMSLLKCGVTRLCAHNNNYKDLMSANIEQLDIGYIIEFDGKTVHQADIKNMTDMFDFHKSDPSKQFCISLNNIINFDKDTIIKLSSIINEIDLKLHIKGSCLQNISDKSKINELMNFWSEINLLDNSYMHGVLSLSNHWMSYIKKNNITVVVSYIELFDIDKMINFFQMLEKKYKCTLITDTCDSYNLYEVIKVIDRLATKKKNVFDKNQIINCVTKNTSNLFSNFISTDSIKKGNKASFNLFDYTINQLLKDKSSSPKLSSLDKQSLTHVWSAGEQLKIQ